MFIINMDKETKNKLMKIIKKSTYLSLSYDYVWREEYKQLDKIYKINQKEVVDILYEIALNDTIENYSENYSCILILQYLILEHQDVDDVTYLTSIYRKMIFEIFSNDKYNRLRGLDDLTLVGVTKDEAEDLYRKDVKTQTDHNILKKCKYQILAHEYQRLYPKQRGFVSILYFLEFNTPDKRTTTSLESKINSEIKKHGVKIVREWTESVLNNEYTSERIKTALKQMKISDDPW